MVKKGIAAFYIDLDAVKMELQDLAGEDTEIRVELDAKMDSRVGVDERDDWIAVRLNPAKITTPGELALALNFARDRIISGYTTKAAKLPQEEAKETEPEPKGDDELKIRIVRRKPERRPARRHK